MKVVRLSLADIKSCNAVKAFLQNRNCLSVSKLNNFSVLPELLVYGVLDKISLVVLRPDWPVNVNIVEIGKSSSVYQV